MASRPQKRVEFGLEGGGWSRNIAWKDCLHMCMLSPHIHRLISASGHQNSAAEDLTALYRSTCSQDQFCWLLRCCQTMPRAIHSVLATSLAQNASIPLVPSIPCFIAYCCGQNSMATSATVMSHASSVSMFWKTVLSCILQAQEVASTSAATTEAAQPAHTKPEPASTSLPDQSAAADIQQRANGAAAGDVSVAAQPWGSDAEVKAPAGKKRRAAEPVEAVAASSKRATRSTKA